MKTIGLLGGTGWPSTITYYKHLNQMIHKRLGGYHSAKILLKSIDYHVIMSNYGINHDIIKQQLFIEIKQLMDMKPDCIVICCNSLHKYYDMIKGNLKASIPVMHAVELTAQALKTAGHDKALLLATQFTMEDGFFTDILMKSGINSIVPAKSDREEMSQIHEQLMNGIIAKSSQKFFQDLINKYKDVGSVIIGCTEFSMVIEANKSCLPVFDACQIQCMAAVNFALDLQ